jgi:glycosyltransferase involved in cell wall biosynthesis
MPKISVLMPVYNATSFLEDAILSLTCQNVSFDAVIVDDGSRDGSATLCERLCDENGIESTVYRLPNNLGATAALQYGLERCTGDYVSRMDADDVSLPGRLMAQGDYLDSHPDTVMVGTLATILDVHGRPVRVGCKLRWMPKTQMVLGRNPMIHGSVMFRRTVAMQAGGYLPCFEQAQDVSLWLRMGRYGKVFVLPEQLYGLRVHADSVSAIHRKSQRGYAMLARWAWMTGKLAC